MRKNLSIISYPPLWCCGVPRGSTPLIELRPQRRRIALAVDVARDRVDHVNFDGNHVGRQLHAAILTNSIADLLRILASSHDSKHDALPKRIVGHTDRRRLDDTGQF